MALEQCEKNHIGWAVFITLFGLLYAGAGFWILYACFPGCGGPAQKGNGV